MDLKERIYLDFAKLYPKRYRELMAQNFLYARDTSSSDTYIGSSLFLSILLLISFAILPWSVYNIFQYRYLIIGFALFILVQLLYYFIIYFKVANRTERIESVLPDWLQLISSNLKAGMTPFQALKTSSRKEFGPLKEEIDLATSKSLGMQSFSSSLGDISSRIKSETLERALKLFTTAMKSGGHLATLLEELGKDIADTRNLKKELVTNTKTYSMFIIFTVIIGTPMLMAVSIHFLEIVSEMQLTTGTSTAGFGLDFLAGDISITPDFLIKISYAMFVLTSLLATMLLGVIKEGKAKYGLRYVIPMLIGTFGVFFTVRYFIGNFF
jgi:archaeal flagellar protein FlaJ